MLAELFRDEYKDFTANSGWLDRWKTRHVIQQSNNCGKKLSAHVNAAKFTDRTKDYTEDQLFNAHY